METAVEVGGDQNRGTGSDPSPNLPHSPALRNLPALSQNRKDTASRLGHSLTKDWIHLITIHRLSKKITVLSSLCLDGDGSRPPSGVFGDVTMTKGYFWYLMGDLLPPKKNTYVEVLTPSSSECDHIWRLKR